MAGAGFTGRARRRKTTWRVAAADRAARLFITLGGVGTILAVTLVCVFLVSVVVPLFLPAEVAPDGSVPLEDRHGAAKPLLCRTDEYRVLSWTLHGDGVVELRRVDTGALLERRNPFGAAAPSSAAYLPGEGRLAFGFPDGSVRFGRIGFATSFLSGEEETPDLRALRTGERAESGGGMVERTVEGQLRRQTLLVELEEPFDLGNGSPVLRIDLSSHGDSYRVAALAGDGVLRFREVTAKKNLLTGKVRWVQEGGEVPLPPDAGRALPDHLVLSGIGTIAWAVWDDGRMLRFDVRDVVAPALAERVDLLGGRGGRLTTVGTLIGKTSLVVGEERGRIGIWFPVRPAGAATLDGTLMVRAHDLEGAGAAVASVSASERTRLLAAGYGDGSVRLFHVTSGRLLGEGKAGGDPVEAVALTPKEDGIVALAGGRFHRWTVRAPHPETTLASIFGKVWYEGDEAPSHVWQSTGGTDDFEPKYGLVPLIFGTLKATLYSMLIAVPLALLGAIFTSEFLHPKVRSRVKPAVELMASLPSVVLGFLAALVFAPWIEDLLPAVLAGFATVPFAVLLGAHAWQLLPRPTALRLEKWRIACIAATLPLGAGLALRAGPGAEDLLFAGGVGGGGAGGGGGAAGGWFLLLLPLCAVAVVAASVRWVNPRVAALAPARGRAWEVRFEFLRFLGGTAAALLLSFALSALLGAAGLDPRGGLVGTYVQRNALVVGCVMGFAVIPIIYTLSEDALAAVPEHLRAASLAVGATRWQTAVSVILPTAMSGLFSALMIGLGRAVGETMVVLMAAGNTPVMEWNVFNGFRTLSANIAVELPEAVQGSTTYRMLYLAALVLFALTFAVNTVAEIVRQRFRRRAFEL